MGAYHFKSKQKRIFNISTAIILLKELIDSTFMFRYILAKTKDIYFMKKRLLLFSVICVFTLSYLYSAVEYRFDLFSIDPLHKEYFADQTRADLSFNFYYFNEGFPDRIVQTKKIGENEHKVISWEFEKTPRMENTMVNIKVGETISFIRNSFLFDNYLSPIEFDFSIQGGIQSFYTGDISDSYGFDGIYFFGGTFRIADFISMRIGNHHYSSHYGDASLKPVIADIKRPGDQLSISYKYLRMNDFVFGLSVEPTSWLRLYGELKQPTKEVIVFKPLMFAPNWVKYGDNVVNPDYPDSYKNRIVNVGVELSYPIFKKYGNTTIGYNLHMYEQGKIKYEINDGVGGVEGDVSFDEDSPWELAHDIKIAQTFNPSFSLEVGYHKGRSPHNIYFFQQTSIISLGLRFNP